MVKIEAVTWSPEYSVGIVVLDNQHKGLIKLTNEFYNHCVGDPDAERVFFRQAIHELENYVRIHFAAEERLMSRTAFPNYAEHKRQHEAFTLNVAEHVGVFEHNRRTSLLGFARFLKDCVVSHIALFDKQYFEYFKDIASRKSDGTLSIGPADIPV